MYVQYVEKNDDLRLRPWSIDGLRLGIVDIYVYIYKTVHTYVPRGTVNDIQGEIRSGYNSGYQIFIPGLSDA